MSLLSLVKRFAAEINVDSNVQTVMGTTDPQITQIKALLETEGRDLSGRGEWESLINEAIHTTVATESQGAITSIATNGFRFIKNDTFWDRSTILPIYVIDASGWQQLKGSASTSPKYQVRIRGGNLISNPTPAAGLTWAFEYVTWNWLTDSAGTTQKQYFTDDADLFLLPEFLLEAGLHWRWKKQKGMEYAEDYKTYEYLVINELSRNGLKSPVQMHQTTVTPKPGICVSEGSWNL